MAERAIAGLGTLDMERLRAGLDAWQANAAEPLARHEWTPAYLRYPLLDFRETPPPWTAPPADLRRARVALIGSAGLYARGQSSYDAENPLGDYTFRALPSGMDLRETGIAHDHFDSTAAREDRNAVFPLERLRELAEAGEIGGLTPHAFAFMGYQPNYVTLIERFIPDLLDAVMADRPDAAMLVPV
ncbi:MAG TPA: glycine/sarcosine/betaine reductase selenoprotein B family protein [Ktedonobacterales bacterium]|nr:glycine/sarcosine/betaine reductase selenoprotein B family protein [Ktedonobacterales bacterium]